VIEAMLDLMVDARRAIEALRREQEARLMRLGAALDGHGPADPCAAPAWPTGNPPAGGALPDPDTGAVSPA
jgi:hypothetical protein